jgi:very-short-patch-repair endonuclease
MNLAGREPGRRDPDAACLAIAARQYGILSREQALSCGISSPAIGRRVAAGHWIIVCRGIYRLSAFPVSAQQALLAACRWASPHGVVSHRAAAGLWKLEPFALEVLEITVPRPARPVVEGVRVHRSADVEAGDRTQIGVFPITTVTRTLIDLGGVTSNENLEVAFDSALRRRMTTVDRVERRLERMERRGRRGPAAIAGLLSQRSRGVATAESPLETRFSRLLRGSRLPMPVGQYEISDRGLLLGRVDFAYPDRKLAIEVDGYEYHHGRKQWQRDLGRRSSLAALGWRVMHFTHEDLTERPNLVVAGIREALGLSSLF